MTAVPEAESTQQAAQGVKKPPTLNIYPVLGIVLLFVLAAMAYGALSVFLLAQ